MNWSIASSGLTSAGQSDLLNQLGSQMREDYRQIVDEPVPDHLQRLVRKLEKRGEKTSRKRGRD